jgi:putative copper export protein/mono/diheme cytochrome c family protein
MTALGLAARFAHLACGLGLLGVFGAMLLAGPSDRPTARRWTARMTGLARWLAAGVLTSGIAVLAHQAAVVAGRANLDPAIWLRLLAESQFGTVWLVRYGLLAVLAALLLLVLRQPERSPADFIAWRLEAWMLSAAALAAMAWAGHAAAAEPLGGVALASDALHLVAAGTWLGALFPLAALLRAASRETGADARPYAVLAIRRFSRLALPLMLAIAATGLWNAWVEVGGVPALIGTRYGRLLILKVLLLIPIAALALANRRALPALSGDAVSVGRPAMGRLARFLGGEIALALAIVAATTALSVSVPGAHDTPSWPLSYRLSYAAVAGVPGIAARLFIGSQLAMLGILVAIVGALLARWRAPLVAGGAFALAAGLWIALPPLTVDAYPTTYERSPVPYQAGSIAKGLELYRSSCAVCHGPGGRGDGAGAAGLPRLPADLTAAHTGQHTAGDLFWWITHGIAAGGMPPFAPALTADERWDLINFLRALAAGEQARTLTARIDSGRPWLVAPDFSFAVGPTPPRSLRDFRGRWMVLVVLFSLPESAPRLAELARAYPDLEFSGAEIVAIPVTGESGIIARIGGNPPILFSVATEGAAEIVPAYALLSRTPISDPNLFRATPPRHAEFLVDRQGYIRARWLGGEPGPGWRDPRALLAEIRALDREAPGEPPAEHVH